MLLVAVQVITKGLVSNSLTQHSCQRSNARTKSVPTGQTGRHSAFDTTPHVTMDNINASITEFRRYSYYDTVLLVAAARQSFKEQEALVYQQLAQLIRDAVWLKSYIAAVMRLEQEAFQSAYASLGPSKATLPLQPELQATQSEQMMMTSGSTAGRPAELQPQVCLLQRRCSDQLHATFQC